MVAVTAMGVAGVVVVVAVAVMVVHLHTHTPYVSSDEQVVQTELMQMGISSEFLPLDISACFTHATTPSQPRETTACAKQKSKSEPYPQTSSAAGEFIFLWR